MMHDTKNGELDIYDDQLLWHEHPQYNCVVSASKGYQPGLSAFIHSFRHYHKDAGIKLYVLDYDLEPEFLEQHINPEDEVIKISHPKGNIWACKIERFRVASEIGGVVGVFDSDMWFCGSMLNYFKIADGAGLIVGGANGSNIRFDERYEESYKMTIPNTYNYKTITSVPTIMDTTVHGDIWSSIYKHKEEIGTGADFNLLNIFLIKYNKIDDVVVIPAERVTNIHHFMLKADTGVIMKEGMLLTKNGLQVLMVHGKWWSGDYVENLMKPMPKHFARLGAVGVNTRAYQEALKSRQLLLDDFHRWCKWPHEPTTKQATKDNVQMERDRAFGTDDYPEGLVERAMLHLVLPKKAIADLRTHGITSKMLAGICDVIAATAGNKIVEELDKLKDE
jgi:hypothetical protein